MMNRFKLLFFAALLPAPLSAIQAERICIRDGHFAEKSSSKSFCPLGVNDYRLESASQKKRGHAAFSPGSHTMPGGRAFAEVTGCKNLLLADKDALARPLTGKLITDATGARVQFADREDVAQMVRSVRAESDGSRSLIEAVVNERAVPGSLRL